MSTLVLLYPGCIEDEVFPAIRRLGDVVVATPDGESHIVGGLRIQAEHAWGTCPRSGFDIVLIPGGDPSAVLDNAALSSLLVGLHANGAIVAAVCAGPSLLGRAGLLQGRRFTRGFAPEQLPFLTPLLGGGTAVDADVVVDDRIVTARPEGAREMAEWLAGMVTVANRIASPVPPLIVLDHVQLAAPPGCEVAARAFYTGVLGLPEREKQGETAGSGGAWFRTATLELHIGVDPDFRPAKKAHAALRLYDAAALQALATRLEEAGYAVRWDSRMPGVRRFFTDDPWGNRLEILVSGQAEATPPVA